MLKVKHGNIVLLNGTSSSGKSTLLDELSKFFADYKALKVDDQFPARLKSKAREFGWSEEFGINAWVFLHNYMTKKTGEYYFDTELREKIFTDSSSFYQMVQDLAIKGQNVIIDTVLEHQKEYSDFTEFFKNFKVIKILVYCPLDILLHRVELRNKSGIPREMRTAFQSFEQFPAIYKIKEKSDEQVVDQLNSSVIKKSLEDSIQDLINDNISEHYLPKLKEFKLKFIEQFKLYKQDSIELVVKHKYDLIINSGIHSTQELVRKVSEIL